VIFVLGNLPFKATASDLTDFLKLPADTEVEIPVFQRNPHKKIGIGFVNVDPAHVEEVLKFNNEEMMGRKLRIALAKAKDQSKPDRWQKKTPPKAAPVSMYQNCDSMHLYYRTRCNTITSLLRLLVQQF